LYLSSPSYVVACAYGQQKQLPLCIEWFLKAKLACELPECDSVMGNPSLTCLTQYAFVCYFLLAYFLTYLLSFFLSLFVCLRNVYCMLICSFLFHFASVLTVRLFDFHQIWQENDGYTKDRLSFQVAMRVWTEQRQHDELSMTVCFFSF
jgi:hypothetical protein